MITHPRRTGSVLAGEKGVTSAFALALGFGVVVGLMFFISYLSHDYPPDAETLSVWVKAWGEWAMLPFLKIPAESYKLFLALAMVPLALGVWMLMAGTGRLLSIAIGGKASYEQ